MFNEIEHISLKLISLPSGLQIRLLLILSIILLVELYAAYYMKREQSVYEIFTYEQYKLTDEKSKIPSRPHPERYTNLSRDQLDVAATNSRILTVINYMIIRQN